MNGDDKLEIGSDDKIKWSPILSSGMSVRYDFYVVLIQMCFLSFFARMYRISCS